MVFRLMSYNVRYFGHALRGAGSTRGALSAIARAIAELERPPDLICLQEVETRSLRSRMCHTPGKEDETQLEAMMSTLDAVLEEKDRKDRYTGYYFPAHAYKVGAAQIYTTGLAVLARSGFVIDQHNADSPHDITHRRIQRVARYKQSRICAHVRFKLDGDEKTAIDVFNTHLSLPAFATSEFMKRGPKMGYGRNQEAEIDRLSQFIHETKKSDRYVVVGDFNSLPASPAYDRFIDTGRVVDPFPEKVGHRPIDLRTLWPTAGFMHLRMRLDHVFLGPGLEAVDFEDTHPFGVESRWDGLSDHVPILGRFRLR